MKSPAESFVVSLVAAIVARDGKMGSECWYRLKRLLSDGQKDEEEKKVDAQ